MKLKLFIILFLSTTIINVCYAAATVSVSTAPNNSYALSAVRNGDIVILTDKKGEKIGILKGVGKDIIWYDLDYKPLGMAIPSGNIAILVDKNGKKQGIIQKVGNTFVLMNNENKQEKDVIHINH